MSRAADAARSRFGPTALACCAGKRFAFPRLRTLAGSNPMKWAQTKNGPLSRTVSKSVVGDEGCPRAAGAARFRFGPGGPRVLRWKTLRVSSAPHPGGFESHAMGPNKNGPLARTVSESVVGDEGFEPPALCV